MSRILNFIGSLWDIVSGRAEIQRLENEVRRLHQRTQELSAYNLRLEMEIKRVNEKIARDKKWNSSDNETNADMLKSRFRDR